MIQRYLFFIFVVIFGLTACGHSVSTRYYLLESAHEPMKVDKLPTTNMRLAQVTVPEYLDRNGIVSRVMGSSELIVSQFHAWAEPVANGVRRLLQERLSKVMLAVGVNTLAPGDDAAAKYILFIDIQRLDGDFHADAVLEARWTLRDHRDNVLNKGIYADREAVSGNTYNELVSAESRMLCRMADHLSQCLLPSLASK